MSYVATRPLTEGTRENVCVPMSHLGGGVLVLGDVVSVHTS